MIELVRVNVAYSELLLEFVQSLKKEEHKIYPKSIRNLSEKSITQIMHIFNDSISEETLCVLDLSRNIFVGAVNLRYELDDLTYKYAGNIGYYVLPSERNKGFSSIILNKALIKFREKGYHEVLMACNADNIASQKSIIRNGGMWDSDVTYKGNSIRRFLIKLS